MRRYGSTDAGATALPFHLKGWFSGAAAMTYNPFAGLPTVELRPAGAALALLCAWPAVVMLFQPLPANGRAPETEPALAREPAP